MAASIGEPVVFADDIKDPSVLNVATCGTEGSVIVTQNPNLINIYKVKRKMTTSVNKFKRLLYYPEIPLT